MTRWQSVGIGYIGETTVWLRGTDPPTLEWLAAEVRQRNPQSKIVEKLKDADGIVFQMDLQLTPDGKAVPILAVLHRLLLDEGWEPYDDGYKRHIDPPPAALPY